jgi:hypothetical protein
MNWPGITSPCSGLLVVGLDAGENEVIVGNRRLTREDRVAPGDLVERVDREWRRPVRRRQQIGVDAERRARLHLLGRHRFIDPVRPDDLFGRRHPGGAGLVGPVDHRRRAHRGRELTPADGEDATAATNLLFLRGQWHRRVGPILGLVPQLARVGIERELVTVPRVLDGLRALDDVEPEIEAVATEDVAHVPAADDHQLEPGLLGYTLEARRAHLTRGPDGKAIAGNHERLPGVHARPEVRHEVPERAGLPALVERLEALRHAIARRGDLIGIDRVELLRLRRALRVPENQRPAANQPGCSGGLRGSDRCRRQILNRHARLEADGLNHVHHPSMLTPRFIARERGPAAA